MKLLLIVGTANDIFIYNLAKWLKASMDITIDVFEFYPSAHQAYGNEYYDHVESLVANEWHKKIWGIRKLSYPFYESSKLKKYLHGKHYDIIHCHWIVPPLVLTRGLNRYCNKLFATFWGREYENFKILGMRAIYKKNLDLFMKEVDCIANSARFQHTIRTLYPNNSFLFKECYLGAASLDYLYDIMSTTTKCEVKKQYNIPENKTSVLIGYSGKSLHQHVAIIKELSQHNTLKEKVHLLAPMTRGGNTKYINTVECALSQSGYSYTLLKDRFLTDEEVAKFRYATDVVLQLSTTDGFSRSIIECLGAKSLMIYGNWLDYSEYLKQDGLEAISSSSIHEGVEKLSNVLEDIGKYSLLCEQNSINVKDRNVWSRCINGWINAYKDVM